MHPTGSSVQTNTTLFEMKLSHTRRETLAFRPSVLTYQLKLYQHKQIHTNPTLMDRGPVAQVAALGPCMHLLQLFPHN